LIALFTYPAVFEILRSNLAYWGHEFNHSGSRDVIGHVTIWFPVGHFLLMFLWNPKPLSLTVSEIFTGECDAVVDMTLNIPYRQTDMRR